MSPPQEVSPLQLTLAVTNVSVNRQITAQPSENRPCLHRRQRRAVCYRRRPRPVAFEDMQLDTFGCVNHVPEREAEQPRHVFDPCSTGTSVGAPRVSCSRPSRIRQVPAALMFRYQSDRRSKFKPMTTVSPWPTRDTKAIGPFCAGPMAFTRARVPVVSAPPRLPHLTTEPMRAARLSPNSPVGHASGHVSYRQAGGLGLGPAPRMPGRGRQATDDFLPSVREVYPRRGQQPDPTLRRSCRVCRSGAYGAQVRHRAPRSRACIPNAVGNRLLVSACHSRADLSANRQHASKDDHSEDGGFQLSRRALEHADIRMSLHRSNARYSGMSERCGRSCRGWLVGRPGRRTGA